MSNYTSQNLIKIDPANIPAGTLAMKVGNDIFTAGYVQIGTVASDSVAGDFKIYRCTSVASPQLYYLVSGAGTSACNGSYYATTTYNDLPVYTHTDGNTTYYLYFDPEGQYKGWIADNPTSQWQYDWDNDTGGPHMLYYLYSQQEYNQQTDQFYYIDTWYVDNGSSPAPSVQLAASIQKTWRGRAGVSMGGTYIFDSDSVSLAYNSAAPSVGSCYTADASSLVTPVSIPSDYVCYCPLSSAAQAAVTGQEYNIEGTMSYQTYKGIPAGKFDGSSYITSTLSNSLSVWSVSLWCCAPGAEKGLVAWCRGADNPMLWTGNGSAGMNLYAGSQNTITNCYRQLWYHYVITQDSGSYTVYVNGGQNIQIQTGSASLKDFQIGYRNFWQFPWKGYISGLRIYNRVLSQTQCAALSRQFTPTA